MASPAPVACAPLAGSFEKAAGAWNQLQKSSPVQRNAVLVLLLLFTKQKRFSGSGAVPKRLMAGAGHSLPGP